MKRTNKLMTNFHETWKTLSFWWTVQNFLFFFPKKGNCICIDITLMQLLMIKGNKEIDVFFSVYIDLSGIHEPSYPVFLYLSVKPVF